MTRDELQGMLKKGGFVEENADCYAILIKNKDEAREVVYGLMESFRFHGHPGVQDEVGFAYDIHGGKEGRCAILVENETKTIQMLNLDFIKMIRPDIKIFSNS